MALLAASARGGMFAAISLAPDDLPDGVAFAVGAPTKRGALSGQTEPWEPRIDNGYSSAGDAARRHASRRVTLSSSR